MHDSTSDKKLSKHNNNEKQWEKSMLMYRGWSEQLQR